MLSQEVDGAVQSGAEESVDLKNPLLYLNRELTWLAFNRRVLHEAEDPRNPLLERLKFLAIVGSNLDEFFMKRIGGLKQQLGAGMTTKTVDGRTPKEQIDECYAVVRDQELVQRHTTSGSWTMRRWARKTSRICVAITMTISSR